MRTLVASCLLALAAAANQPPAFRLDGPADSTLQRSGSPRASPAVVIALDR
jgi:hypothetical protein